MAKLYPSDRGELGYSDVGTNPYGVDLTPEEQAKIDNQIMEIALGPGSVSGGISNIKRLPLLQRILSKTPQIEEQATKLLPKPELSQPYPSPDFINAEEAAARKAVAQSNVPVPETDAQALDRAYKNWKYEPIDTVSDIRTRDIEKYRKLDPHGLESAPKAQSNVPEMLKRPDPEVDLKAPLQSEDTINIFGAPISKSQLKAAGLLSAGAAAYPLFSGNGEQQTPPRQPLTNKVQEEIKKQDPSENQEAKQKPQNSVDRALAETPKKSKKEEKQQETLNEEVKPEEKAISEEKIPSKQLDFTGMTGASVEGLKAAQEGKDTAYYGALFGKVGSQLGSALAGATKTPDTSVHEELMKHSDSIVKDYQDRVEMEKKDPNSAYSQGLRSFIGQLGYDVKGGSAEQISAILPQVARIYELGEQTKAKAIENQLNREARKEDLKYKYDVLKEMSKIKAQERESANKIRLEEKQDQLDQKRFDELGKRLNPDTASGRTAFGKDANVIRGADSIKALVSKYNGDFNQIINTEIVELARSLDSMLSQGQPTITGTKKLIPETILGDASKIQSYILGIPKGAEQKEFVERMVATAEREKQNSLERINRTQNKILSSYKDLKKRNPEKYNQILEDYGIQEVIPKSSKENLKSSGKVVVKKGYNSKTNQTQLIYSDGSKEIVEGRQ